MEASSSFCYRNLCFASSSSCTSSWDPFPDPAVGDVASDGREAGTELGAEEEAGIEAAVEGTAVFLCLDPAGEPAETCSLALPLEVLQ